MLVMIRIKKLFVEEWKVEWIRWILTVSIFWLFMLQGVYVSTVIMNLLVSVSPALTQVIVLRAGLVIAYLFCTSMFTMPYLRKLR